MPNPSHRAAPTAAENATFELTPAALLYLAGRRGPAQPLHTTGQIGWRGAGRRPKAS